MAIQNRSHFLLAAIILVAISLVHSSLNSNYPTISTVSLKKIFDGAKPYADLTAAFYSIKGNALLGETLSAQNAGVKKI